MPKRFCEVLFFDPAIRGFGATHQKAGNADAVMLEQGQRLFTEGADSRLKLRSNDLAGLSVALPLQQLNAEPHQTRFHQPMAQ
jgi:hypothetical protein